MYNLEEYEVLKWGKKITDSLFLLFLFFFILSSKRYNNCFD